MLVFARQASLGNGCHEKRRRCVPLVSGWHEVILLKNRWKGVWISGEKKPGVHQPVSPDHVRAGDLIPRTRFLGPLHSGTVACRITR